MKTIKEFDLVREWAKNRGLYEKGDVKTQFVKLMEEAGEVGRAIIKSDEKEFKDGLGDMVVVLVNLAHIYGTSLEECLELAYTEIKNRKGSMKNGSFVKEEKKLKKWQETTGSDIVRFLVEKCLRDCQFNKLDQRYLGFININPSHLDYEDYAICLYIINNQKIVEGYANDLGLTITHANHEELIINELIIN